MRRLLLPDLIAYMLDSAGDVYLAALGKMADIIDRRTEGMMRRKYMEGLACYVEIIHSKSHVQTYVGLREHDSLALARSSGCEYDRGQLIYVNLVIVV